MGITKNEKKKKNIYIYIYIYGTHKRWALLPPPQSDLSSIVWLALKWRMRQYSELTTNKTLAFHLLAASLSLSLSLTPSPSLPY